MAALDNLTVRRLTVARIDRLLKVQRAKSCSRAKRSLTILSMLLGLAVRRGVIAANPVKDIARMKRPKRIPKALTEPSAPIS
ncbi:hypothetical protein [Agromyces mariniharenae]|uniref:Integrase n=1 Tax=Agromyces mariniharenae TaxID=2604423 RepID=A0A5S4V3A5_9MICO|nr:hypothetical protein [Agromyces mariniharenae]TYL51000.1 hypothetical protein FYC51_17845 [Agromyces mariniharenae]